MSDNDTCEQSCLCYSFSLIFINYYFSPLILPTHSSHSFFPLILPTHSSHSFFPLIIPTHSSHSFFPLVPNLLTYFKSAKSTNHLSASINIFIMYLQNCALYHYSYYSHLSQFLFLQQSILRDICVYISNC